MRSFKTINLATLLRLCVLLFLSIGTSALHAQNLIGKRIDDAILQLGNEYDKVQDGPVTKLRYPLKTVDHPGFGSFKEYNQYDFLNGVCEARHTYMPYSYKQGFTDHFNEKFGFHDHLWRGDAGSYIAIKEHDDVFFELMVWTPAYETYLDNK